MRVVVPVLVPRPSDARVQHLAIPAQLLEARAVDAPNVAIFRRKRAAVRDVDQPAPGKRKLHRPPTICVGPAVDHSIDMHRSAQPWVIPIEKAPPLSPWMHV